MTVADFFKDKIFFYVLNRKKIVQNMIKFNKQVNCWINKNKTLITKLRDFFFNIFNFQANFISLGIVKHKKDVNRQLLTMLSNEINYPVKFNMFFFCCFNYYLNNNNCKFLKIRDLNLCTLPNQDMSSVKSVKQFYHKKSFHVEQT